MKFILRVLEVGTAIIVSFVVITLVVDHTILDSNTVLAAANKTSVYTEASRAIPNMITGLPVDEVSDLKVILSALVTPEYLKAQATSIISQVEASMHTGSTLPSVSFAGLLQNASEQGYVVPPAELQWLKTVTPLSRSPQLVALVSTSRTANSLVPKAAIVALILLIFIVVLAGAHRYGALAKTALLAIVGIGVWLGMSYLLIGLSVSTLDIGGQRKPFAEPVGQIAGVLDSDMVHTALWPAAVLAGLAIVMLVLQLLHGRKKSQDPKSPLVPPSMRQRTERIG